MDTPMKEAPTAMTSAQEELLFKQVKMSLGWPSRQLPELTDDVLRTQLQIAMEEYSALVYEWLISQQWGNLQGQEVNATNFVLAFTNRTLDYVHQFTAAYGKQTGIGGNANWELKKDYIEVVAGQQVYDLPANREVNEVLWATPPVLGGAGFEEGSLEWLATANGWMYGSQPAGAILPTYSTLLYAQDRLQKNRVHLSELTYKITGGADGGKQLHLYPVPGSAQEITGGRGRHETGSKVWYWYYDTNAQGRDKCAEVNEDIIHLPDEVPLQYMSWGKMNLISQTRVRKFLVAAAGEHVALVRGMFKGEMPSPSNTRPTISVDYQLFLNKAEKGKEAALKEIAESLDKMTPVNVLKRQAEEAKAINDTIRYQPPKRPFIMA